jgi:hypothetical protein
MTDCSDSLSGEGIDISRRGGESWVMFMDSVDRFLNEYGFFMVSEEVNNRKVSPVYRIESTTRMYGGGGNQCVDAIFLGDLSCIEGGLEELTEQESELPEGSENDEILTPDAQLFLRGFNPELATALHDELVENGFTYLF